MNNEEKIKQIMSILGCSCVGFGHYTHSAFNFNFDMSATGANHVMLKLSQIFADKGYKEAQSDIRNALGL